MSETLDKDFKRAEQLSLPITLLVLVIAFGALVAAGLPLLLALTAIAATLGLLGPISQLIALDPSTSSVVLLIGLAVGVDYSMIYLRRAMEERDAGADHDAALNAAAATSGRTVLISGVTVPAFGIHTITTGDQGRAAHHADLRSRHGRFPGGPIPAVVAIQADDVTSAAVQSAITRLKTAALATGQMSDPITTTTSPDNTLVLVNIPLQGDGTDAASDTALDTLRGQ